MKRITQEELNEILKKHEKWLSKKDGGERADLSFTDCNGLTFYKGNFERANFIGTNLSNTYFYPNTSLSYSNFNNADFTNADLESVNIEYANFEGAILNNTDISFGSLAFSNLKNANITNTNLYNTNLKYTSFERANLSNTYLDYTCFPFWNYWLNINIDDIIVANLLHRLLRNVSYSSNVSEELKQKLLTPELVEIANRNYALIDGNTIDIYDKNK